MDDRVPQTSATPEPDTPQSTPSVKDWRFGLIVGLSIGVALPTSQGVQKALQASLGPWGAFFAGVVAAAGAGGLVALVVHWLLTRGGGGSA